MKDKRKAAEGAVAAAPAPVAGKEPVTKPPARTNDCATLWQRFYESSECLAPYLNVNGSIKPNAFEACGPAVPFPAQECS